MELQAPEYPVQTSTKNRSCQIQFTSCKALNVIEDWSQWLTGPVVYHFIGFKKRLRKIPNHRSCSSYKHLYMGSNVCSLTSSFYEAQGKSCFQGISLQRVWSFLTDNLGHVSPNLFSTIWVHISFQCDLNAQFISFPLGCSLNNVLISPL